MKNADNKLSGSYYTPHRTIAFMERYLSEEHKVYHTVLEPSAGDGRFLDVFGYKEAVREVTAVELIEEKAEQLKHRNYPEKVKVFQSDFLDFAEKTEAKYQLIIGNPPYINLKNIEDDMKEKAKKICVKYKLPVSLMKNIWVAFVLASVSCLEKDGAIFFVLPLEFLQVQYAEKIRLFLEEHFDTIHILSFKERMFPKIEQEACLVYLTNEHRGQPYISFKIYEELDSGVSCYHSVIERNKPLIKWTNAVLSDEDLDLLSMLGSKYKKVSELCDASPGIVTGANNEFILTKAQVEELACQELVLPVIPKSNMVSKYFVITQPVVRQLGDEGNRIYLLNLAKADESLFSEALREYLEEIGNAKNSAGIQLKERYKCKRRKPWYGVPIVRNGDLFFFKRYDKVPRLCVNEAGIHTTDIAYNMRTSDIYDRNSMAFCFYNSLTLAQCEYYGRYYAGGVSELTPSEFKKVVIPYQKISAEDVKQLAEMFAQNKETDKIIAFVNSKTIAKELEQGMIKWLDEIREKLMERRIGNEQKRI